tara:strand:+ start:434 stop:877 length:444 start_codon:yes stop_codon:yes gene_type:complete
MASPKLTCIVTGKSRPTTYDYLQKKATRLGTTVADLQKYYVSREALTRCKNADVTDVVVDREAFNKLTTDKPWLDIIALNTRGKASKRNVTAKQEQVVTTVVESKLSPETEAYEKQKEELLGKEAVAAIKKQVWDEEDEEVIAVVGE